MKKLTSVSCQIHKWNCLYDQHPTQKSNLFRWGPNLTYDIPVPALAWIGIIWYLGDTKFCKNSSLTEIWNCDFWPNNTSWIYFSNNWIQPHTRSTLAEPDSQTLPYSPPIPRPRSAADSPSDNSPPWIGLGGEWVAECTREAASLWTFTSQEFSGA